MRLIDPPHQLINGDWITCNEIQRGAREARVLTAILSDRMQGHVNTFVSDILYAQMAFCDFLFKFCVGQKQACTGKLTVVLIHPRLHSGQEQKNAFLIRWGPGIYPFILSILFYYYVIRLSTAEERDCIGNEYADANHHKHGNDEYEIGETLQSMHSAMITCSERPVR